jgi:hypothetical protein
VTLAAGETAVEVDGCLGRRSSIEESVALALSQGLIDAEDVVDHDLCVREVGGRNTNFRLTAGTQGLFFKQAPSDEAATLVATEAGLYRCARDEPGWSAARPWLPSLRFFDPTRGLLITDAPPMWRDVFDVDAEGCDLDLPPIADLLGRALAACHGVPANRDAAGPALALVPNIPWVLGLHRPHPRLLRDLWPAQLTILRGIQLDASTGDVLDALARNWRADTLVHGDLKFNNVLVAVTEGGTARAAGDPPAAVGPEVSAVLLVDWETASLGDRAWDVGSVFQSYLWFGVHLVSTEASVDAAAAPGAFAARLPAIQRCVQAFWNAYRHDARLTPDEARDVVARATAHTGARLLQTAFELAQGEERPSRLPTGCLQLALNVLRDPGSAQRDLLGIRPPGSRA